MEIITLTIREDFHRGHVFFSFSYHKITLFEKKYDIKLITLSSMCHLKPLVSLGRFIETYNADAQIALCTDTVQILFIEKFYGRFVRFENTVSYFDKIVMFFHIGGSKSIYLNLSSYNC